MRAHECHHCRQWIEEGEAHDCWTTTEAALTGDLPEDLQEAYERLRETAVEFGDQRIYASGKCIMFSRDVCYFFIRPKRSYLEVCVFLGRPLKSPLVHRAEPSSKKKFYNIIKITHRDQVEAPISDWLREAYEFPEVLAAEPKPAPARKRALKRPTKKKARKAKAKRPKR
jgi:hypothetical protein